MISARVRFHPGKAAVLRSHPKHAFSLRDGHEQYRSLLARATPHGLMDGGQQTRIESSNQLQKVTGSHSQLRIRILSATVKHPQESGTYRTLTIDADVLLQYALFAPFYAQTS